MEGSGRGRRERGKGVKYPACNVSCVVMMSSSSALLLGDPVVLALFQLLELVSV